MINTLERIQKSFETDPHGYLAELKQMLVIIRQRLRLFGQPQHLHSNEANRTINRLRYGSISQNLDTPKSSQSLSIQQFEDFRICIGQIQRACWNTISPAF